jgi:hypothetical protein
MVADTHSPRVVAESPSETMSTGICSPHSPQWIETTVSSSPKTGTHRRGRRRRSARMLAVFLLVVSIVVVHIIKCSRRTRSYTAIYRKEEWVPVLSFERAKRHVSRSQHKMSSLEHARVMAWLHFLVQKLSYELIQRRCCLIPSCCFIVASPSRQPKVEGFGQDMTLGR